MQRRERHKLYLHIALCAHVHDGSALFVRRLRQRVFQRRPGIAHRLPPDALGAVDMPQRDIVKVLEKRGIDVLHPAHAQLLRARRLRPGYELVADENVALCRVDRRMAQHSRRRVLIALYRLLRIAPAHVYRLYERQQAHNELAVLILHCELLQGTREALADIYAAAPHERGEVGQAPLGVVIPADGKHPYARRGKRRDKAVERAHRLARRG